MIRGKKIQLFSFFRFFAGRFAFFPTFISSCGFGLIRTRAFLESIMTDINSIMLGPRLKVKRAHRHIDELMQRTSPLDPSLYTIAVEKTPKSVIHKNATVFQLAYRPKKPIPETLALAIGDAIHNLRAALDHLANAVIRAWHPSPEEKGYFPMGPKREDFVASRHFAPIEEAIPGAKKFLLEKIRPEDGANERLWAFGTLDNDDKHNLILPTVTFAQISNINAVLPGNNIMRNCGAGGDATRPSIIIRSEGGPISVENNLQTSVDVKFGQGTTFENEPVIPTLLQFAELTSETLNSFERFIRENKPTT
jgi:hypothetical protein